MSEKRKNGDRGILYPCSVLAFFIRGRFSPILRAALLAIYLAGGIVSAAMVFHVADAQALVPSLYDDESDYTTPKWTHVLRSVDKEAKFLDGEGPEDDGGCPSNTVSEMPIGDILAIFLSYGFIAGIPILIGTIAMMMALMMAMMNIIEGVKVACPVPNPEYPGQAAYWDRAWKDKIVFRYGPCIGFLDVASVSGQSFKAALADGQNAGGGFMGIGDFGGYMCLGIRVGDGVRVWGVNHGTEWVSGAVLGVTKKQDKICLYVDYLLNKMEIVCQYLKPKPKPLPPAMACFMPKVCADSKYSKARYPVSVTGKVSQCVEGAVRALFEDNYRSDRVADYFPDPLGAGCTSTGLITKFHEQLKRAVTGALTLYIILYGMKVAFGGQQAVSRSEFMIRMMTFVLVSYFAIGEGWKEFYPLLLGVSNALAGIVMDSSSGGYYCSFPAESYPPGYEYLRLWDTLDCKVFSYFTVNTDYPKLFAVAVYTFFGGGIVILLFGVIMVVFLVAIMVYILQIYLGSIIGVSILAFLSPIFVPLQLFGPTRKYFSGWLNALLSLAMYPVVLFGFLALILVTLDIFYWGEPRVGASDERNPKNYWRYAPNPDVAAFRCTLTGSAYMSVGDCRKNCMHSECYLDESLFTFPVNGLWLCPLSLHTYQGANAQARCNDQCYEEYDSDGLATTSLEVTDGTRWVPGSGSEPGKFYRSCVNGNYKPEFKAQCKTTPDGPVFTTKEECELPVNCVDGCKYLCDSSSFGCQLYRAKYGEGSKDMPGFKVEDFAMGTALLALLKVLGICVLFFYYLDVIGPTIAEMTGSHKLDPSRLGSSPKAVMQGAASLAKGAGALAVGAVSRNSSATSYGVSQLKQGAGKLDGA